MVCILLVGVHFPSATYNTLFFMYIKPYIFELLYPYKLYSWLGKQKFRNLFIVGLKNLFFSLENSRWKSSYSVLKRQSQCFILKKYTQLFQKDPFFDDCPVLISSPIKNSGYVIHINLHFLFVLYSSNTLIFL